MDTAATSGLVVINIYDHWCHEWGRAWSDVGRLAWHHQTETHIAGHEVVRGGWCECWECRVYVAWQKRYEPIVRPKGRRAGRKGDRHGG